MRHLTFASRFGSSQRRPRHFHPGWPLLVITLVILGFIFGCVPRAHAQSQVRAVRLSSVEGSVQLMSGSEVAFEQAYPNMPLVQGTRIQTGGDGRTEVQFEDGSVVRITPNSALTMTVLARHTDGTPETRILMESGLAYFELDGAQGRYGVTVGQHELTPAKSVSFRVSLDANPGEIAVLHGVLHMEGGSAPLDAKQNSTVRMDRNDASHVEVAEGIGADSWDDWNRDRDKALQQMTAVESGAHAGYGNANDPAWASLDYYGNWYNMPGYGAVWTPAGAGAGFDPFGNGMWGNYPGWGYTWISGYNWGWWPYHCGAWNYFDSMGWGWMPGDCGFGYGGWGPVVPVWNTPRGYVPPARPHPVNPIGHRPGSGTKLIAVNRGSSETWNGAGIKPVARPVNFHGTTVQPVVTTVRTEPVSRPGMNPGTGLRPVGGAPGGVVAGRAGFAPGTAVAPRGIQNPGVSGARTSVGSPHVGGVPSYHPSGGGGGGGSAPHMSSGGGGGNVGGGGGAHVSSGGGGGGGGGGHVK